MMKTPEPSVPVCAQVTYGLPSGFRLQLLGVINFGVALPNSSGELATL